jgi:hypothetical protein
MKHGGSCCFSLVKKILLHVLFVAVVGLGVIENWEHSRGSALYQIPTFQDTISAAVASVSTVQDTRYVNEAFNTIRRCFFSVSTHFEDVKQHRRAQPYKLTASPSLLVTEVRRQA